MSDGFPSRCQKLALKSSKRIDLSKRIDFGWKSGVVLVGNCGGGEGEVGGKGKAAVASVRLQCQRSHYCWRQPSCHPRPFCRTTNCRPLSTCCWHHAHPDSNPSPCLQLKSQILDDSNISCQLENRDGDVVGLLVRPCRHPGRGRGGEIGFASLDFQSNSKINLSNDRTQHNTAEMYCGAMN